MNKFLSENNGDLNMPLLSKETEFKAADCDYNCLQIIIRNNDSNTLKFLLNEHAIDNPTPIDYYGLLRTAMYADANNCMVVLLILLNNQPEVINTPIDYNGLLRTAMYADANKCMRILMNIPGVDVTFTDKHLGDRYYFPILWLAAFNGKVNAVNELLKSSSINVHQGPPFRTTLMSVDKGSVIIDVGGLSPIDVATIELNTLRNKPDSIFQNESTTQTKNDKIKSYLTIIALLTDAGAKYSSSDKPDKLKRKVVPRGGKSRNGRKKSQPKKTKKCRSRKQKK